MAKQKRAREKSDPFELVTPARGSLRAGSTVRLGDHLVSVVRRGEIASADIVVCIGLTVPLMLPDNRTGVCAQCGASIQYRQDVPKGKLLCIPCGDLEILIERRKRSMD